MTEQPNDARRWTRVFFATSIGVCLTLAILNFVVNPYGYYPSRCFPPLTWSSREKKVQLLRAGPPPEIIVLGSSRAMMVAPSQITELTGKAAFNAAVDSARVEDWWALYAFAKHRLNLPVREIVLGIDIEAFHDHLDPDGRLLSTADLRTYLPRSMQWKAAAQAVEGLLGYVHTIDSVRSLRLSRTGYPPPPYMLDSDGLIQYTTEPHFDPGSDPQMAAYDGRYANFSALDIERRKLFETLLTRAEVDGVRIHGYLTPLHARLVERLRQTRDFDRLHALAIAYLHTLAERFQSFSVVDYTDVAAFGGDAAGFRDVAHIDNGNCRLLLDALSRSERAVQ